MAETCTCMHAFLAVVDQGSLDIFLLLGYVLRNVWRAPGKDVAHSSVVLILPCGTRPAAIWFTAETQAFLNRCWSV